MLKNLSPEELNERRFLQAPADVISVFHISTHREAVQQFYGRFQEITKSGIEVLCQIGRAFSGVIDSCTRLKDVECRHSYLFAGSTPDAEVARSMYLHQNLPSKVRSHPSFKNIFAAITVAERERLEAVHAVLSALRVVEVAAKRRVTPQVTALLDGLLNGSFKAAQDRSLRDAQMLRAQVAPYLKKPHVWQRGFFVMSPLMTQKFTQYGKIATFDYEKAFSPEAQRTHLVSEFSARKRGFADEVSYKLDLAAECARSFERVPDSTVRKLFLYLFLREELTKELPTEIKLAHGRTLGETVQSLKTAPMTEFWISRLVQGGYCSTETGESAIHDLVAVGPLQSIDKASESLPRRTDVRREIRAKAVAERVLDVAELVRPTAFSRSSTIKFHSPSVLKDFRKWTKGLSTDSRSALSEALSRLRNGQNPNVKWVRAHPEILRLRSQSERIYFTYGESSNCIILSFGEKADQDANIEVAWKRYKGMGNGGISGLTL